MIERQHKTGSVPVPVAAWAFSYDPDENEVTAAELRRLIGLLDEALPPAPLASEVGPAEAIAAKIIRHLTLYERAWFSRRRTTCWLYGLSMCGVSSSSTTSQYVLLLQWRRMARLQIGALS